MVARLHHCRHHEVALDETPTTADLDFNSNGQLATAFMVLHRENFHDAAS